MGSQRDGHNWVTKHSTDDASSKEPAYQCQCRRHRDSRLIPGQANPLEKEVAAHSSILAWKIPRTEEPGGLQSMGSQRVGHD